MTLFKRRIIKLTDGIKKIAINYLQFASLALNLDMPWTNVLCQLFKIQSYSVGVSNALLLLDCILADTSTTWDVFQLKFFGTLMLPILFIPIAYVIVKYVLHGGWDEFVASLILFWYLMYPQIVKAVITFFSCTYMIDGTRYMIVDPDVKCFDYGTSVWIGIVLSFMVYIVGMPAISFLAIKRLDRKVPENRLKFGKLFALILPEYYLHITCTMFVGIYYLHYVLWGYITCILPPPCLWGYIICTMFVGLYYLHHVCRAKRI